jgi:hypothetical protein
MMFDGEEDGFHVVHLWLEWFGTEWSESSQVSIAATESRLNSWINPLSSTLHPIGFLVKAAPAARPKRRLGGGPERSERLAASPKKPALVPQKQVDVGVVAGAHIAISRDVARERHAGFIEAKRSKSTGSAGFIGIIALKPYFGNNIKVLQ